MGRMGERDLELRERERIAALSQLELYEDAEYIERPKKRRSKGRLPPELRHLVVHFRKKSYDVYIARPSPFGNPYSHKTGTLAEYRVKTRGEAIIAYEKWLLGQPDLVARAKTELRGKVLGCWCAPQRCHGEVLARIANEGSAPRSADPSRAAILCYTIDTSMLRTRAISCWECPKCGRRELSDRIWATVTTRLTCKKCWVRFVSVPFEVPTPYELDIHGDGSVVACHKVPPYDERFPDLASFEKAYKIFVAAADPGWRKGELPMIPQVKTLPA